jgi:hypothetical protein
MADKEQGEIQVRTGENGDVELTFKFAGKDAIFSLSPDQISGLASNLLAASYSAFIQTGKSDEIAAKKFEGQIAPSVVVNASGWHLGSTNVPNQRIIIARVGESAVTFTIASDRMRSFGRTIVEQSWRNRNDQRLWVLLRNILADFFSDLKSYSHIFSKSLNALLRRSARTLWLKISGRSLRLFRMVDISSDAELPNYNPVGECIYCGSAVYSDRANSRRSPLGSEHIIAEGLGGKLELPEASCQKCEDITGRLVEGDILLRTLKALRMHLKIRGKSKSSKPATLPLSVKDSNNQDQTIQVPIEDYPVILNMPAFGVPPVFRGGPGGNQVAFGFRIVILNYDPLAFQRKYKVGTFASPYWDTHMLFRMLGKVGHSFAAAELGTALFKPALVEMILKGSPDCFNHIGGEPDLIRDPPSKSLHEIGLGYQRANGKDYVVARIRLFASHMGPIYYVVVGESLESSIAKFKRIFLSRVFPRHMRTNDRK